jgi:hypothetical protein
MHTFSENKKIFFSNPLRAVINSSRYVSPYSRYDGRYYPDSRYDGRYDGRYDSRYTSRLDSQYDDRYDGRYPYAGNYERTGLRKVEKINQLLVKLSFKNYLHKHSPF